MEHDNISIDLRGKSADQVQQTVIANSLGDGNMSDITDLYPNLPNDEYTQVLCVWLHKTWEVVGGKVVDKPGPKTQFVLWNGRSFPQRWDCDLHGFVKNCGHINWGQAHTINLMR